MPASPQPAQEVPTVDQVSFVCVSSSTDTEEERPVKISKCQRPKGDTADALFSHISLLSSGDTKKGRPKSDTASPNTLSSTPEYVQEERPAKGLKRQRLKSDTALPDTSSSTPGHVQEERPESDIALSSATKSASSQQSDASTQIIQPGGSLEDTIQEWLRGATSLSNSLAALTPSRKRKTILSISEWIREEKENGNTAMHGNLLQSIFPQDSEQSEREYITTADNTTLNETATAKSPEGKASHGQATNKSKHQKLESYITDSSPIDTSSSLTKYDHKRGATEKPKNLKNQTDPLNLRRSKRIRLLKSKHTK